MPLDNFQNISFEDKVRTLRNGGYWVGVKNPRRDIVEALYENREKIRAEKWNELGSASLPWQKQYTKFLKTENNLEKVIDVQKSNEIEKQKYLAMNNNNESASLKVISYKIKTEPETKVNPTEKFSSDFPVVEYKVKLNDNLWKIAKMFYCSEKEIISLNKLKSDIIREGQILKIQPGTKTDKKFSPDRKIYSYLLTADDLQNKNPLEIVAARFSGNEPNQIITADDIKTVNNIDGKKLYVGQHLWITKVTIEGKLASWYGNDFHGQIMANGKKFNAHKISCASRDLPLGALISIENLQNKKLVRNVPVSDRGPYFDKSIRALDISLETAKQLGMIEQGVSPVKIIIEFLPKMPDLPLSI